MSRVTKWSRETESAVRNACLTITDDRFIAAYYGIPLGRVQAIRKSITPAPSALGNHYLNSPADAIGWDTKNRPILAESGDELVKSIRSLVDRTAVRLKPHIPHEYQHYPRAFAKAYLGIV